MLRWLWRKLDIVWGILFGPICPGSITVALATTKHLVEAVTLVATSAANGSVGINAMLTAIKHVPLLPLGFFLAPELNLAAALLLVSGMAIYAMHARRLSHHVVCALLLPQQSLLVITMLGAIVAVIRGQYADGYVPVPSGGSAWFILADQVLRIALAPAYTLALLARANSERPPLLMTPA
jgi:hypothetical protein